MAKKNQTKTAALTSAIIAETQITPRDYADWAASFIKVAEMAVSWCGDRGCEFSNRDSTAITDILTVAQMLHARAKEAL